MCRKTKTGFTLVELLVVISIITLLSSVVISNLNGARTKAALAASRQFSASVYHAAGDEARGIWEFEECSGAVTADLSGNGNTGTLSGASFSTDTPTGRGCSLSSNGTQYLGAGSGSSLGMVSQSVTVMEWVKIVTSGGYNYIFSNDRDCCGAYNGFSLQVNGSGRPVFRLWNGSAASVTGASSLVTGRWYHVLGTYDGSTMKVYVNGKEDGSLAYSGGIGTPASAPAAVGALGWWTAGPKDMLIDSVYVFAKSLVASDVEAVYARFVSTQSFAKR